MKRKVTTIAAVALSTSVLVAGCGKWGEGIYNEERNR